MQLEGFPRLIDLGLYVLYRLLSGCFAKHPKRRKTQRKILMKIAHKSKVNLTLDFQKKLQMGKLL